MSTLIDSHAGNSLAYHSGMANYPKRTKKERTAFGQRVYELYCKRVGPDRTAAAKLIGIAYSSLWEQEFGGSKKFNPDNAVKAAKVLGTTVEYLITGEGPRLHVLGHYPPDVVDIATLLSDLPPRERQAVRSLVEQMAANQREQRFSAPPPAKRPPPPPAKRPSKAARKL
jgi:hypothetical protein